MNARTARILAGVTAAAGIAAGTGPPPLAVAAGLLLGFVLPGLALTAVLFRSRVLTMVERAMLAPALSLAVLVVAGLVAYAAGQRLDRPAWTAATMGVTLVALIVPGVPLPHRPAPAAVPLKAGERRATVGSLPPRAAGPVPVRRLGRQLIPMVVVVAMLGAAAWLSLTSARRSYDVTVTTLSAAPPGTADAAGARTVAVTATGLVPADGPYALVVSAPDGTETERRAVAVPAGGTWTGMLAVGPDRTTIRLYRTGDATAYRTVYIAVEQ